MKYNGIKNLIYERLFEVRGSHNEYKVPEVKSTDITKKTKATINRLQSISIDNVRRKQLDNKEKDDRGNINC